MLLFYKWLQFSKRSTLKIEEANYWLAGSILNMIANATYKIAPLVPQIISKPLKNKQNQLLNWRRERDSNPRYAINVYTLSRRAPSTTRPPLRCVNYTQITYAKIKLAHCTDEAGTLHRWVWHVDLTTPLL